MFDVFYIGTKPGIFPHERAVASEHEAQQKCRTRMFWLLTAVADYTGFDFTWEPAPWEAHQRHTWRSQWQKTAGVYLCPKLGYVDTNYRNDQVITRITSSNNWEIPDSIDPDSFNFSWHPDESEPPYIYQFGTQWQKSGGPRYVVPGATQVKYIAMPKATATQVDITKWEIPAGVDTSEFDFTWHPDESEPPYIYQFGTQWQRTGGPRYVVPGATQVKYVAQIKSISKPTSTVPVVFINHYNSDAQVAKEYLQSQVEIAKETRFVDNYFDTLKRIAKSLPEETQHIWITTSVCDYRNFDFSWHPSDWQSHMLHVFPSDEQKFGDTFYLHLPTFRIECDNVALLDWYHLNFVDDIAVPRLPVPVVHHEYDTNAVAVSKHSVKDPLTVFTTSGLLPEQIPTVPLWRDKTRAVTTLTKTGSTVIVPRDAVGNINTQLWDYPYVDTSLATVAEQPLDVVFISNGEPNAEEHWQHLKTALQAHSNRVVRVEGVNGRVAAYKAAATASNTPWFLAVFAKLKVEPTFDWNWTPDYLQAPKHYIFYAKNPVNGLEYGHQAMIAYHKKLCLENAGTGLDFTLDQEHEVIPELSGVAMYNSDPWTAWRTAFREVIKLRRDAETSVDYSLKHRLERWQSAGVGANAEWSQKGAVDAIQYYEQVNGDFDKLKLSYEWAWLKDYYTARYS